MADPAVAERVKLTADQREKIRDLLDDRKEKLAAAAEDARPGIIEESDKKLAGVLTQVQHGDFIGKPVEKRLTFMFRFQPWVDVLDWLAENADLSLVIPEAPPPATFNYTDTREYTPTEAIDLLNSVLIHNGYTLVRRERMLLVINIEGGIPEGIAPQVGLAELDKRGKFELVTVRFPTGRRPADSVTEAVKSLLGPHGKVVPVPATQEVMVTDMARVMPLLSAVIEAMPEPPAPPPTPTPAAPETPEVRVYPVKVADPETAIKVLSGLLSTATFVLDPDTKRINANATPSQHTLVESVLAKMEEEVPPEKQRVLEVYSIDEFLGPDAAAAVSTQLLLLQETLQKIVPAAELSINDEAKRIVAWATPAEQETIKTSLDKLKVERAPEKVPQLEVFRLTKVDPTSTLTLLNTLLPDARLAVDLQTKTLIALGSPADLEVIRNTLKTLQPDKPGPDAPELRFYELALAMPPSFLDIMQKVAPESQVVMDATGNRLMVVATPADHAKIEKTIESVKKKEFMEGLSKLQIYPVTPSQRKRFEAVMESLTTQLPGIKVITDAQPGELAVWAKPQQHEVLVGILEELRRDVPAEEKYLLAAYPVASADPTSVLTMLQELFPDTKLVLDAKGKRLLAWTSAAEHESIKTSLEQIESGGPPTVEIYPLTQADVTTTMTLLSTLVPEAQLTPGAKGDTIVARAVAADHETIKATLQKLDPEEPGPNTPQLQFYPFEKDPPASLMTILANLAPKAQITADAEEKRLIVVATPSDHKTIQATIERFKEATPDSQPQLVVYPVKSIDSTSVLTLLTTLVPEAQLTVEAQTGNLVALALADEHQIIKDALDQLQPETPGPDTPVLRFHPLAQDLPADLLPALQKLVPKAQMTVDIENRRLMAVASAADHEVIQSTVEEFVKSAHDEPELRFHALKQAPPPDLLTALQKLAPRAQITVDSENRRLMAVGSAADHVVILATIEQFEKMAADEPELRFHPLVEEPPPEMVTVLQGLVPKAQITPDSPNKRLMVIASAEDHATIQSTIAEFETSSPETPELRFHPLVEEPPADLLTVLTKLVPKAQITLDAQNKRLMAVASPEDHKKIESTVREFEANTPPEEPSKLVVYAVTPQERKRFDLLQPTLSAEMPGMTLIGGAEPGELAIWAKPTEHLVLSEIVEQLKSQVPDEEKRKLVGYRIKSADPDSVLQMLQKLYPDTEFVLDLKANRL
ncbi:MAG: hypothetical protein ABIP48_16570, partial [Planctomycetota bacterium]